MSPPRVTDAFGATGGSQGTAIEDVACVHDDRVGRQPAAKPAQSRGECLHSVTISTHRHTSQGLVCWS